LDGILGTATYQNIGDNETLSEISVPQKMVFKDGIKIQSFTFGYHAAAGVFDDGSYRVWGTNANGCFGEGDGGSVTQRGHDTPLTEDFPVLVMYTESPTISPVSS